MPDASNAVREVILSRRTIFRFRPDPVPPELLHRILEVAVWAPNHRLTEPWRFAVVGPRTKEVLVERYGALKAAALPDPADGARRARVREAAEGKLRSKPAVLAASCRQEGDEVRRREDYAATCCAMQNVQLAAWAEGLGMQWSTSALIHDPAALAALGVDPEAERVVGLFYVGWPADVPGPARTSAREWTRVLP